MKIPVIAVVVLAALVDGPGAQAADLGASVRTPGMRSVIVREPPTRVRVYARRAYVGVRTVGMPCVLPPQAIVRRNWNGPQCRWVDNVIPGDLLRARYRVATRW